MKYSELVKNVLNGKVENRTFNRARQQCETFSNDLQALSDYVQKTYGTLLETLGEKPTVASIKKALQSFRKEHVSRALLFVPCSDDLRKQVFGSGVQTRGDYVKSCLSLGVNHQTSCGCRLGFVMLGNTEQGHALIAKGLTVSQAETLKGKNAKDTLRLVKAMTAQVITPKVETDKTEKATPKKVKTAKKVKAVKAEAVKA